MRVKIRKKDLTKHRNTQERKKNIKKQTNKNILRVCIKEKERKRQNNDNEYLSHSIKIINLFLNRFIFCYPLFFACHYINITGMNF